MKKVITVTEVEGEGLKAFLNRRIFIITRSYFYEGILSGINTSSILLEDAKFVLESGSFESKNITNSEKVPGNKIYVQNSSIGAFFESHSK